MQTTTTTEPRAPSPPPPFTTALHQLQAQVIADQLSPSPLQLIHMAIEHGFSVSLHPDGLGDYPIPVAMLLHCCGYGWPLALPDPPTPDGMTVAIAGALGWPLLQQPAAATSAPALQQDVAAVQPQPQQHRPKPTPKPDPAPQQQAAPADLIGPGSPEHPVVDPALLQPITKAHRDKAVAAMRALSADQRKVLIGRFREHFQIPAADTITGHLTQQQHLQFVYGFIDELALQAQQGAGDD